MVDQKNSVVISDNDAIRPSALTIDFEEFAEFFEDEDVSEEEAREFLVVFYSLALEFMSLGFGFHPVQQAKKACGKESGDSGSIPLPISNEVYLTEDQFSKNFERVAEPILERDEKESINDAV